MTTTLFFSASTLLLQIFLPGYLMGRVLGKRSLSDLFFLGFLTNALLVTVFALIISNAASVARAVHIALAIVTIALVVIHGRNKKRWVGSGSDQSPQKVKYVFWVGFVSMVFLSGHIVSHNFGYDDIAHLQYLLAVSGEEKFPLFRAIIGSWYGARYPYYGIVIGGLGSATHAGVFLSYYMIGALVLICFLMKVYEEIYRFQGKYKIAIAGVSLCAMVLHIGGIDSYFNFGLYPLQQSKLLVLTGLLYLLTRPNYPILFINFTIGSMLVVLGVSYHLNLLLLVPAYLPIFLLVLFLRVPNGLTRAKWLATSLIFPLLLIVGGTVGSNPIITYQEPVTGATVSAAETSSRVNSPDLEENQSARLGEWLTKGRERALYIKRAYGVEMLLLPGIFLVSTAIKLCSISWLLILLSLGAIVFGAITSAQRLPAQAITVLVKSGPIVFVSDLLRSGIDRDDLQARGVVTDPYSAVVLQSLGINSAIGVQLPELQYVFSPLFTVEGIQYGMARGGYGNEKIILFNPRIWGPRALERFRGGSQRVESVSARLHKAIRNFGQEYQHSALLVLRGELARLVSSSLRLKVESRIWIEHDVSNMLKHLPDTIRSDDLLVYRDSGLFVPGTWKKDTIQVIEVYGTGDSIIIDREVLPRSSNAIVMKFHMPGAPFPWVPKGIALIHQREHKIPYLLFTLNIGHLGSLGNIDRAVLREYPCWITPTDLEMLLRMTDLRREWFFLRIREKQLENSGECGSITENHWQNN